MLNLGREFHYVGVQFLPGVWQGYQNETTDSYVGTPYKGNLPLVETNNNIAGQTFCTQQPILPELVHQIIEQKVVAESAVTAAIE